MNEEQDIDYPLVSDRYKVVLIDGVIIIILMVVYSSIIAMFANEVPSWVRAALYSTLFLYEPLAIAYFGKTVGHWSGKLEVVKDMDNENHITLPQSLLRSLIKYGLGIVSLFTITKENRGRALHDMAVGSIVKFEKRD